VKAWGAVAALGALLLLGVGFRGFGDLYHAAALQPWSSVPLYCAAAALVAAGALFAAEIFRVRGGGPVLPGQLLFPLDLVEVSGQRLRGTSLANLTKVDVRSSKGGAREIVLSFADRSSAVMALDPRDPPALPEPDASKRRPFDDPQAALAAHLHAEINKARALVLPGDRALLDVLDPFLEIREEGSWGDFAPASTESRPAREPRPVFLIGLAALVLGALTGPLLFLGRNALSDGVMFAYAAQPAGGPQTTFEPVDARLRRYVATGGRHADEADEALYRGAKGNTAALEAYLRDGRRHLDEADDELFEVANKDGSPDAFRRYLGHGKKHVEEVRATLLPRAELARVKAIGTLQEYRRFLKQYPGSPFEDEVKRAMAARYEAAREKNRTQTGPRDSEVGPFFAGLIDHLERRGDYSVAVSFKNVAPESVAAGDRLIRAKGLNPLPYVDAARYFGAPFARELEQALFDKVSAAVAESVPLDVVRLRPFEPEDTDIPVIQIDYQLRPVSLYIMAEKSRSYMAVAFEFMASFRIPSDPAELVAEIVVEPPGSVTLKEIQELPSRGSRQRVPLPAPVTAEDVYKESSAGVPEAFGRRLASMW
jgi:hypothetical protein